MSEDIDIHDEIEAYLKGKLKGKDLELFNEKLKNFEFREKVELQRIANNIVITKQLSLLKEQMEADFANKNNHSFFRRIWPILLLIPFSAATYFLLKDKETNTSNSSNHYKTSVPKKLPPAPIEQESPMPFIIKKEIPPKNYSNKRIIPLKPDSITVPQNLNDKEDKAPLDNSNNQNIITPSAIKDSVKPTIAQQDNIICNLKLSNDQFNVSAACEGKTDGSININPEKNLEGKDPFKFSISNGGYTKTGTFLNLAAGLYTITVRDAGQCMAELEIEVPEKKCKEIINDAFNPNVSTWRFPMGENEEGSIKIYNKSGRLVYSKDIFGKEEWNGRGNSGQELEEGLYVFVIVFKDGTEQNGYISIMY